MSGRRDQRTTVVSGETRSELLVENNTEKRIMHSQSVVVVNESELPEFVHEEIHA